MCKSVQSGSRSQARIYGEACGRKGIRRKNLPIMEMREKLTIIPDRSRPGLTTAVTSDCKPRATGGHHTIWVRGTRRGGRQWRRKKERNEETWKAKRIEMKVRTLNVGTMTGKGREVAYLMERRSLDVLCVQETR